MAFFYLALCLDSLGKFHLYSGFWLCRLLVWLAQPFQPGGYRLRQFWRLFSSHEILRTRTIPC